MESQQNISAHLRLAWQQAVVGGELINEFQADRDAEDVQWAKGDRITFGIQQQDDHYGYYAHNLTQNCKIESAVEERAIAGLSPGVDFTCLYNGYRALRPGGARKSLGRQPDISAAPNDCRFACQDSTQPLSLLARTPLFQQSFERFTWKAYYNVAPIEPNGHFLWVPTRSARQLTHLPQVLSLPLLEDAFTLFKQLSKSFLFFNALHSGASVNHIHFQSIESDCPLPAETFPLIQETDYATPEGYPAYLMMFDPGTSARKVFKYIDLLQTQGIPFNLMMTPRFIILVPRNINFEIVSEFPGNGLASLGMCGRIITIDRAAYLSANRSSVESAFKKMSWRP
ncbi:MAG: hypothetical protein DCF25_12735 [Leptolyngbya foveolarum]|uniref:ATP adenylyltransferase C-terminal domain-containing protein n=1 Tax=Leptolyngbya foveolarum TaxID=47253 RepID=A0A2W4U7W4_9CYAN|nr:MAG: hypothetical protein DCF25_12735 [Leptolyngbya foveolarum]